MFWCFPIVPIALSIAAYWNGWKERSWLPLGYVPVVWMLGAEAKNISDPSVLWAANILSIVLSLAAAVVLLWMAYNKPKRKPKAQTTGEKDEALE